MRPGPNNDANRDNSVAFVLAGHAPVPTHAVGRRRLPSQRSSQMRSSQRGIGSPTGGSLLVVALLSQGQLWAQTPSQPAAPTVSVSGLIFGNYQYHLSGQSKEFNQFLLDRAYVNVRASVSDRVSIRVTTDVFQSGDQNGWTIRAKYAYLQYDFLKRPAWNGALRAGMLHNVMVEQVEQFWPRFISQVAFERSGGFAAA